MLLTCIFLTCFILHQPWRRGVLDPFWETEAPRDDMDYLRPYWEAGLGATSSDVKPQGPW